MKFPGVWEVRCAPRLGGQPKFVKGMLAEYMNGLGK